ncbi:MAG: GNAT family N-acetyltransferase, partial [Actinomycetota bacterium]
MIAETERLVLREQTMDDLDPLTEILGDPVTMSFYPRAFNRDQVRTWIERSMKLYESRGFGLWAMILKETGEFVGQCGLTVQDVEGVPLVEIGWHVDRIHWRRGYASEAAAAARDRGFDLGLVKLVSLI